MIGGTGPQTPIVGAVAGSEGVSENGPHVEPRKDTPLMSATFQRGFIDEIIRPRQTRAKLITALATLDTKRDKNPKKHGNIPL